jgi:hypothetical protein
MLKQLWILVAALAVTPFLASHAAADAEPSADAIRQAVAKALPLLQKGAIGHREQRTCFACHSQGIPILAMTTAKSRGFEVNDDELAKQQKFIAEFLDKNRANYLKGKGQGGQADTAGYALWTLELAGWKADDTTAAVAEYMIQYQKETGHWKTTANRPPSELSPFTTTYLGLRTLRQWGSDAQKERIAERVAQSREWLLMAKSKDNEDRVFRLWAMKYAGMEAEDLASAAGDLVKGQRQDGGWGQLDTMDSDAYATGTALVVLHQAGTVATNDPVYRSGLKFLLNTQRQDGTWHVKTRSRPFQTYFETGFPHGKDQFISSAASGWATTALALACPIK